jgi:hypothetical protein
VGYTKRQFISEAFAELGLADYVFDLNPEDLQRALRRLDSMLAEWNGKGIRLGYPIPSNPDDSDLDEATGVPDSANEAIIVNLALKLAPGYGKTPAQDSRVAAYKAYNVLLSRAAIPPQMQYSIGLPSGAGHKPTYDTGSNFMPAPTDNVVVGPDSPIDLE